VIAERIDRHWERFGGGPFSGFFFIRFTADRFIAIAALYEPRARSNHSHGPVETPHDWAVDVLDGNRQAASSCAVLMRKRLRMVNGRSVSFKRAA
jgi:hypothetical protein